MFARPPSGAPWREPKQSVAVGSGHHLRRSSSGVVPRRPMVGGGIGLRLMSEELGLEPVRHDTGDAGQGIEVMNRRRTVVTALPLKKAARERLAQLLEARVLDVREPFDAVDLVLTPACSPQLIGGLQRKYPDARVVIVELDDWDLDIELGGPVKRLLRAGAAAYVLADSIEELAAKISATSASIDDPETSPVHELTARATVDELIAAFLRESVEYSVRTHVAG